MRIASYMSQLRLQVQRKVRYLWFFIEYRVASMMQIPIVLYGLIFLFLVRSYIIFFMHKWYADFLLLYQPSPLLPFVCLISQLSEHAIYIYKFFGTRDLVYLSSLSKLGIAVYFSCWIGRQLQFQIRGLMNPFVLQS